MVSHLPQIDQIPSFERGQVSHPFVERLIGTIRREFLDHVLIWNAVDLGRKLEEFRNYYRAPRKIATSANLCESDL
jgi:putative transposase